jgi:nucleoside-diphosphate kinase
MIFFHRLPRFFLHKITGAAYNQEAYRPRPVGAQPGSTFMQKTLVLLKPDCVHRRLIGTIIERFERKGLRLAALKLVQASRQLAEKHYAVHKGKAFYESLLQFLTAGPTVAMVWEGREAVAVARALMGATDGTKAPPATIRGDFAINVQNNLVHGSDSPENAAVEIALWFRPDELVNYEPVDAAWVAGA